MPAFQPIDSHTSASLVHQRHSHSVACMHDLDDSAPGIIGNSIDLGWIFGPPPRGGRSIWWADVAHSASKTTGTGSCCPIDLKDAGCWHARHDAFNCFQGGDARCLVELNLVVETVIDNKPHRSCWMVF